MANINEPRYDTDLVNKAYVDNLIGDVSDTVDDTLQNIDYNKNFGSQPAPPYHMNDTWMDGTDIYTCINTRLIGEYVASDWTNASKYVTQPSLTNQLNTLHGSIEEILDDLQDQIDGVMEIHTYEGAPTLTNQPAINWTTDAIKKEHLGDIYNDMLTGDSYRFILFEGVYQWLRISDSQAAAAYALAQDAVALADNKRRIFSSTPFTPYDLGDLWTGGPSGALHRCKITRLTGAFQIGDWEQATGYDNTKTTIDGGLVTTGTVTVVQGGTVAAGITGNTAGNDSVRFWAGSTLANRNNAPFRVTQAGNLKATNADIEGKITADSGKIGGWEIHDIQIKREINNYSFEIRSDRDINQPTFLVYDWNNGRYNFYITQGGSLYARNAEIKGKITADSGTIGGWNIGARSLVNDNPNFAIHIISPTILSGGSDGDVIVVHNKANSSWPFILRSDGSLIANKASISGTINATSGAFKGKITSTSGNIAGWNLTSTYLYNGGINGNNGARLYNDGRLYMKNNYGWLNTGAGGTILSGNGAEYPVVISDNFSTTTGGGTIGLRALFGNIRIASNYAVRISGSSIDLGGSNITSLASYSLAGHTFSGGGGARMYANTNCMLDPASGYYAYINSTSSSNRIATSSAGPSSRNVKKNIKEITKYNEIYKDLQKLRLHTFDYKYKGIKENESDFGFIIDEVEELTTISKLAKHYDLTGYLKGDMFVPKRDDDDEKQKKLKKIHHKEWDRDSYIKMSLVLIKSLQEKVDSLEGLVNEKTN